MGDRTAPPVESDAAAPLLAVAFPEAAALGARLLQRRMTIAVAESCTGGLLGAALTAGPGSSAYVRGGIIAYANDAKADNLGVGRHLLVTHGAVSAEVAMAMARGAPTGSVRRSARASRGSPGPGQARRSRRASCS
jgi:nicotinamide-nucleotide amidase